MTLWRSVLFLALFFGLIVYIIPHIIWLITWVASKIFSFKIRYAPFGWTAFLLMLFAWGIFTYGSLVGRFQSVVNNIEYISEDVPEAFDGFRIAHISDLHTDSFNDNPEALQKVIDKVNAQNPDIILFTGDMSTGIMTYPSIHEKALKSLHSKMGVVSILGNHDFFLYCPQYKNDKERCLAADKLTSYEREVLGWQVLRNNHLILHQGVDSLAIAGVDNINGNQGFRTIQKGDLKKAMNGLDDIFTILMTHDPSHWRAEVLPKSHAQITLSGHTHASQIRLFGWSFANFAFRECDGRYNQDGRMLYVNTGIGCTAPFRIGCPSEITIITLKKKWNLQKL